jgi:transposase
MSLPIPKTQGSLFDVPVLTAELFKDSKNPYRLFREKILPTLWDARDQLAELYCQGNGRPAIEPVLALGVTVLQFMEKVPDRKAEENLRMHLGWKYALDLEIGYEGFDHSSLCQFRARLLEGGAQRIGFDAILGGLREAGLVRKRSKQRLDSTHVLGAVARMSRLEVVRETLRLFLQMVEQSGRSDELSNWNILLERYIESEIQWHRASKQSLAEKFAQAGADALGLIKWARPAGGQITGHDKTLLLERVFLEQFDLSTDTPQRRKQEASGVVKNPHDPDVQWATKDPAKKKQWEGYKVQICETVDPEGKTKKKGEPTEQFVTELSTTQAIESDLAGRRQVEENQSAHGQEPSPELYVDAGYVTDDTLAEAQEQGRELIGPARPSANSSGKDLFTASDFDVDIANRKAICPAGHESSQCSHLKNQNTGQVNYRFEWGGLCDDCPLQKQCTKSRNGRRMLLVGQHHDHLQKRRREMKTEQFQKRMQQRNGIEGTVSEFARGGGRRTRYRSLPKTTLANYFQGAAINAKRWIRLAQWNIEQTEKAA